MNTTLNALVRRVTIFVSASLGSFVACITAGVTYGALTGAPVPEVLTFEVAIALVRVVVNLTAGHAIALACLAYVVRGFATPSLRRSAASGVACALILEAAYLSSPSTAAATQLRIVQMGAGVILSLLICAVRERARGPEAAPIGVPNPA